LDGEELGNDGRVVAGGGLGRDRSMGAEGDGGRRDGAGGAWLPGAALAAAGGPGGGGWRGMELSEREERNKEKKDPNACFKRFIFGGCVRGRRKQCYFRRPSPGHRK
jgi:hypothetical protein